MLPMTHQPVTAAQSKTVALTYYQEFYLVLAIRSHFFPLVSMNLRSQIDRQNHIIL